MHLFVCCAGLMGIPDGNCVLPSERIRRQPKMPSLELVFIDDDACRTHCFISIQCIFAHCSQVEEHRIIEVPSRCDAQGKQFPIA